jgi:hypothetical protein
MEGGDLWNMFKTANRKITKNVAPYVFGTAGAMMPLIVGQPELVPAGLAVAGVLSASAKASLPVYGKNKKRLGKLAKMEEDKKAQAVEDEPKPTYYTTPHQTTAPKPTSTYTPRTYSTPNNISSNSNMPYRRYSSGSGLHAPRSRGCGFDSISPLSKASLGHAEANSMLGKMESHMAQARQHNQGLVGVSGNLINQIAPLQSQPQQNFQFRHTLITPAYRPSVYGQ